MIKKILILFLALLIVSPQVSAVSKDVNSLKEKKSETDKKVADTDKKLKAAEKEAKKSLSALNEIKAEIEEQRKAIKKINNEIGRLKNEEKDLTVKIEQAEQELQKKKDDYAQSIRAIYRKNLGYNAFAFLFSANTFSQTIRRARYLKEFSNLRKNQAYEIKKSQEELEGKRQELQNLQTAKNKNLSKLEEENKNLKTKENKQKEVVNKANKNKDALTKELAKQKKQAAALKKEIEKMIAEEVKKSAKNKAPGTSQDGYIMTEEEQKLAKNFADNKGKLPMPLSGKYIIVEHYGKQQHQDLKYVQVENNGIVIKTQPETLARSIFNGTVTKVFVMPGYNSSVIVRHGNYLTIYSNLEEVYVKIGDVVKTKQNIGKIYSDPEDDNSTLLHFQLWKERSKLNPELWLGK